MIQNILSFGSLLQTLDSIVEWIENTVETIQHIFADVDFTILYNWLPNDIAAVITAIIAILLFMAVFGLLKRLLFFLG